jgi:hypothetical protein
VPNGVPTPAHCLTPRAAAQVSGREFVPVATHRPARCPHLDGFVDGAPYPYATDPHEAAAALQQHEAWAAAAAVAHGRFVPACAGSHLMDVPTARLEGEMMDKLVDILSADWEGVEVRRALFCVDFLAACLMMDRLVVISSAHWEVVVTF